MGGACSPEGKPIPSTPREGIFQSLQLSHRAGGSQRIPRRRDSSPAKPGPLQAPWRVPSRSAASGVPQGQEMFLMQQCQCNSPNSAEKQWVWTRSCPGFLSNGHFPPTPLFFQVQSFPRLHSSILRIPRQLETLPKARRGETITLLQQQLVQPGLCNQRSRSALPTQREAGRRKGCPLQCLGGDRGQEVGTIVGRTKSSQGRTQ